MRLYLNSTRAVFAAIAIAMLVSACSDAAQRPTIESSCTPACTTCGEQDGCGGTCPCADDSDDEPEGAVADVPSCEPVCDGSSCRDGCGGSCACTEGTVCAADGKCKSPDACLDTCESTKFACGSVCGRSCGQCEDTLTCVDGRCLGSESCTDCGLSLAIVAGSEADVVDVEVRLSSRESDPSPRMIDLRIRPNRPVALLSVTPGSAMTDADKTLYFDAEKGHPWKAREDGSYQLLIHGFANTKTIAPGRLLTMRFHRVGSEPVSFALEKRAQTFAPASADAALQRTPYDRAAVAP
jgi:hypothetical protein